MKHLALALFGLVLWTHNASAATQEQEQVIPSLNQVGSVTHGFKLKRITKVKEADSVARLFEHVKTGAKLLYLSNKDDNKVFSITFRTIPQDNTGLPHILEHSVLCGSRKFPTKEPFVELMKGSVNTFLNAMTYPDKTVYPVASKNDKDFRNLMDVYLDAVFYPRLHQAPEILKQEGWHYEVDPASGELSYNGVVYNEMKGVFSSPESVLSRGSYQNLFPKGTYGFESGGEPMDIPSLTQKQFTDFHQKYYHPSNSLIYLYGNGSIEEHLKFIQEEYLAAFKKAKVDSRVIEQKPFAAPKEVALEYSINPTDAEKDRSYFTLNYAIGKATDPEQYLSFGILEYILLESSASPLKRALLDAGIGKDVGGEWENGILQTMFSVIIKNTNPDKKKKFMEVVQTTLERLTKDGIDKKLIEAAINRKEFQLREFEVRGYPKGLAYNFKSLDSWLYGADPLKHIQFEPILAKIKKEAKKGYFEKLIKKHLLKNNHRVMIVLTPKKGLDQEKAKEIQKKLTAYKAALSAAQIEEIKAEAARLKKIQQTPDSPEAVAKIPLLDIKDLDREAEKLPLVEHKENGTTLLHHPVFTNKIGYLGLYFDTSAIPLELVPYLPILTSTLGRVSTKNHTFEDLSNEINIHTGGIGFGDSAFSDKESLDVFYPKVVVRSKAVLSKLPKLAELTEEILLNTQFNDKKRLREILQELRSRYEGSIASSGIEYSSTRVMSYFSKSGKYDELTGGITFFHFLSDLENNFDKRADELSANLKKLSQLIFNRNNLLVSFTSDDEDFKTASPVLKKLMAHLPSEKVALQKYDFKLSHDNEGLVIPSKVQFVTQAADFRKLGFDYSGSMLVLENILSTDYLWNRVRVQGGAYGAFIDMSRNGFVSMSSYRDPNLKETLQAYAQAADYLKGFEVSPREMNKFIIGTVSRLDRPLTPSMKGEVATSRYISRITPTDVQKTRDEVLSTQPSQIQGYAGLIKKVIGENYVSVIGSEGKLKENESVFKKLVKVFE